MITEEQAARVLHRILKGESPSATKWSETWGTLRTDEEAIGRGLQAFESQLPEGAVGVLHGWIDQAALEIISIGTIPELRDRAINYRADQGGDTGILTLVDGIATVLDISFEEGEIAVREYQQAEQDTAGQSATVE